MQISSRRKSPAWVVTTRGLKSRMLNKHQDYSVTLDAAQVLPASPGAGYDRRVTPSRQIRTEIRRFSVITCSITLRSLRARSSESDGPPTPIAAMAQSLMSIKAFRRLSPKQKEVLTGICRKAGVLWP